MTLENFRKDERLQNILFDDDLLAMSRICNKNNSACPRVFKTNEIDEILCGYDIIQVLGFISQMRFNLNDDYFEFDDNMNIETFYNFKTKDRDYYIFDSFIDFLKYGYSKDYDEDYELDLNSDLIDYIKDLLESEVE